MAGDKIRIGIVGAGRIAGLVHVPSFRLWPEACEVVAVASRTVEGARAFAERWGIPRVHPDWPALLADPGVDAVALCLPSGLTAAATAAAVAAGKHVLCEKPLALAYPEAAALAAAARHSPRVHMVAFTFRFVPALRYLRRLVAEGHFGEIRHWRMAAFTDFMLDPAAPISWRSRREQAGAGILTDVGTHGIDFARQLLGEITAVSGVERRYVRERPSAAGGPPMAAEAADGCALVAEFAGGAVGSFDLNRAVAGRGGTGRAAYQAIEIHGTGGAAVYELTRPFELQFSLGPAMTRGQQWTRAEVPVDLRKLPGSPRIPHAEDPLLGYRLDQGIAFLQAIRGETDDYPTFADGAAAQRVVDAAEQAMRERRWIPVSA